MPTTVVIVGTTGAGKTRLSVDVALAVDGEIVSADAFQVYRGLEVASNAATPEERKGVPHHMIGVVDVDHVMTVTCFRDMAVPIVSNGFRRPVSRLFLTLLDADPRHPPSRQGRSHRRRNQLLY